ncbi:MAG: hypothetical protein CMD83_18475 [Gammaproteobacteria bacterium]|nr:hypothetical protein [Gammaproteobacteria bacterium]
MSATREDPEALVRYAFTTDMGKVALNDVLGHRIRIEFSGRIRCQHCGTLTPKSYAQGYCYPCFKRLAETDLCVVSPDRCHYADGTCRDPAWGERFCMDEHVVYLANSSGIKVGITKPANLPTRWIDQGAVQGLPVARVATRQQAGLLEVACARHFTDKTQWQRMLMADDPLVDMAQFRETLARDTRTDLQALQERFGLTAIQPLSDAGTTVLRYPVLGYPSRVVAINPQKRPLLEGQLIGIKGQYLMLDSGVINLRRYIGYEVAFSV